MVPEECWYSNLRSVLKPSDWDTVRRDADKRAGGRAVFADGRGNAWKRTSVGATTKKKRCKSLKRWLRFAGIATKSCIFPVPSL